eukprot:g5076.t1
MIFFSLVLVLILEVVRGGFVLDAAKCEQLMTIPPPDPLLEKEHCSVCEQIVHNSRSWNWAQHYESLCVNIPPHAMSWCMHYVCKLTQCEYFTTSSCPVIRSKEEGDSVFMDPCPAKYLCSYCLDVPQTQVFGCFDGFKFD